MPQAKTYLYRAYGQRISCDRPLPYLRRARFGKDQADIIIRARKRAVPTIAHHDQKTYFVAARNRYLDIHIPRIMQMRLFAGKHISYFPASEASNDIINLFLLRTGLGAVLQQKGLLVLRGMAFADNGEAHIIVGAAASGKTTLAAVLHKEGFKLLCDELCVIDHQGKVLPGIPVLKLWFDCFRVMQLERGMLDPLRAKMEKYAYLLHDGFCNRPLKATTITQLSVNNEAKAQRIRFKGVRKATQLSHHRWQSNYLHTQKLGQKSFNQVVELAANSQFEHVMRPQSGLKVVELIDYIRELWITTQEG